MVVDMVDILAAVSLVVGMVGTLAASLAVGMVDTLVASLVVGMVDTLAASSLGMEGRYFEASSVAS
jgi:predicted lipid-binding transport protein (Tim44 family)